MSRSVAFYKDMLGIPMKFGTPEWTEFQTGTTVLALHGGGQRSETPKDPSAHHAGTCSIGFNVDNLDLVYEQLQAKGVVFLTPPTAGEGEGIKLAVAMDPDGLPISFGQSAKK
jgi:lactoylglutathione lyase